MKIYTNVTLITIAKPVILSYYFTILPTFGLMQLGKIGPMAKSYQGYSLNPEVDSWGWDGVWRREGGLK